MYLPYIGQVVEVCVWDFREIMVGYVYMIFQRLVW